MMYFGASPLAVGINKIEGFDLLVCFKTYSYIRLFSGEYSPNFENPPPPIAMTCRLMFFIIFKLPHA